MNKTDAYRIARYYRVEPGRLLTTNNPKTAKGESLGFLTAILHLAPADLSGYQVCPMAELAGCIAGCLNTAGRGGIAADSATFTAPNGDTTPDNVIQRARINRTRFYYEQRAAFMTCLAHAVKRAERRAEREGLQLAVRLNGTSDIRWEHGHFCEVDGDLYRSIMDGFPAVQWYDYTKIPNRRNLPANYHLTWSYSEASDRYAKTMPEALNAAVVFRVPKGQPLPDRFKGRRVVDADRHDLRFLDGERVIAGLRAKGRARHDTSGFVVDC